MAEDLSFEDMGSAPMEGEMPEGGEMEDSKDVMEDLNETLSMYNPEDIVKWLVDQGKLSPDTQILAPEQAAEGMPGEMAPAPAGGGELSFADMMG